MYINFDKLAKFVKDKRETLDLGQKEFAEWIEKTYGEKISYGLIAKIETRSESIPEFKTMSILANLAGLSIDDFVKFLQDDSIKSIDEIEQYKSEKAAFSSNPSRFMELFKTLPPETKMTIFSAIAIQVEKEAREAFRLQSMIKGLQN